MIEYEKALPDEELMSPLLKGLKFLFVPNNSAKITSIRKTLARNNGAIINSKFRPGITTTVVVDTKIVRNPLQILKVMEVNTKSDFVGVSVLDQTWLLQSIEKNQLLEKEEFEIDIPDDIDINSLKRRKIVKSEGSEKTKTEMIAENINVPDIQTNPNQETMTFLKDMANECTIKGDTFKARAYRIAVDSLFKSKTLIKTQDQAIKLPGVGKSIAAKIEEITQTHTLDALNKLQHSEVSKLMKLFKGIYGVGNVIAHKWINEGARSIKDVENRNDLTHNQRLGIEHYNDWNERIQRNECTAHKQYILDITKEIDPKVEMTIAGSYRRGAKDCGDIDYIVTKPNAELNELKRFLDKLLDKIKRTGYHQCTLTIGVHNRWMGGCALPKDYLKIMGHADQNWGKCRRVDFLLVPWIERGAAFIYFTGNDEFNKKIRLRAQKNGMVLNQAGLYKRVKGVDVEKQDLIEGFSERKIFDILQVKWREPTERNIGSYVKIDQPVRQLKVPSKK